MKKILAICLTLVMVMSFSLTVSAEGGFVESPSRKSDLELVGATPSSPDCDASIVLTPYSDRDTLPDDANKKLKDAYDMIQETQDLTTLNDDLKKLADELGIPASDLAVSDLFDLSCDDCDDHDEHGDVEIIIKAENLDKFVGLMYFNGESWELIDNATVIEMDGQLYLKFSANKFGPYAVVVNTGDSTSNLPPTGDSSHLAVYVIVMAASVILSDFVWRKYKKQSA